MVRYEIHLLWQTLVQNEGRFHSCWNVPLLSHLYLWVQLLFSLILMKMIAPDDVKSFHPQFVKCKTRTYKNKVQNTVHLLFNLRLKTHRPTLGRICWNFYYCRDTELASTEQVSVSDGSKSGGATERIVRMSFIMETEEDVILRLNRA